MSRRKSFVYDMYPQDFNDGVKGLDDRLVGVYIKLINLMRIEGGPLPPRKLRLHRSEFDEWIRDKLGHKNIRTWLRAKRELLADPDKLVELPDGRIVNPRTERDVQAKRPKGGEGDGGAGEQNVLPFDRPTAVVDNPVGDAGEEPGEAAISVDDRANIDRSSADVRSIRASKPLKSHHSRCAFPYPYIRIPHEVVAAAGTRFRARDGPQNRVRA